MLTVYSQWSVRHSNVSLKQVISAFPKKNLFVFSTIFNILILNTTKSNIEFFLRWYIEKYQVYLFSNTSICNTISKYIWQTRVPSLGNLIQILSIHKILNFFCSACKKILTYNCACVQLKRYGIFNIIEVSERNNFLWSRLVKSNSDARICTLNLF